MIIYNVELRNKYMQVLAYTSTIDIEQARNFAIDNIGSFDNWRVIAKEKNDRGNYVITNIWNSNQCKIEDIGNEEFAIY